MQADFTPSRKKPEGKSNSAHRNGAYAAPQPQKFARAFDGSYSKDVTALEIPELKEHDVIAARN